MTRLPELDIARVRRWFEQRVPARARDQVRVERDIGSRHLAIVECRPPGARTSARTGNGSHLPAPLTCRGQPWPRGEQIGSVLGLELL